MARPENSFGNGRPTDKPVAPPYQHQEYPRVMHHASGAIKFVKSLEEEEVALADGYGRQPHVTEEPATTAPKAGECPNCIKLTMEIADLKVVFDKSWKERAEQTAAQVEALNARIETQRGEIESLLAELAEKQAGKKAKAA
jgi:uncharacterized small protein (DUF1192 family)